MSDCFTFISVYNIIQLNLNKWTKCSIHAFKFVFLGETYFCVWEKNETGFKYTILIVVFFGTKKF